MEQRGERGKEGTWRQRRRKELGESFKAMKKRVLQ